MHLDYNDSELMAVLMSREVRDGEVSACDVVAEIVDHIFRVAPSATPTRSDFLDICYANDISDDVVDGFDALRDFAPITHVASVPNVLVTHPSVPATNVKELIAHIKSRPGQMQFASAGVGSMPHLMMEFFVSMAGLKMNHVPYKGAGVALVDVIAGHVPLMAANILSTLPQVRAGKLRAYGVTSAKRSPGAPDIPAISESGLPGYDAVTWFGVLAPAGLPRDIVTRLHTNVVRAVNDAGVRKRFIDDGADPSPSASPEAFAALIRSEVRKWATVIKDAGIQPE